MATPAKPNNPFEELPKGEDAGIEESGALMVKLLKKRYDGTKPLRGVHPKSHGCVNAKFNVLRNIDKSLQVGLFREPGACFDAVIRYSNADSLVRHDLRNGENGSRGMAIKIDHVPGEMLYDDGRSSQDFLMISTPEFAFANVEDYVKLQRIQLKFDDNPLPFFAPLQSPPPTEPKALAEFMRIKRSFEVVTTIKQTPVANPLEVPYFGAAPFLFGKNRVMRVSVSPRGEPKKQVVPTDASENYLREALQKTMAGSNEIVLDFKIQVRKAGEDDLQIEDATRAWSMDDFPPHVVATITISAPQTDLDSEERLEDCEEHFFTPWHALAEHQPLGGINRLRRAVYLASSKHRLATRG